MYVALLYEYVPDIVERRAPFREAHLARLQAASERGELVLAGAFSDSPAGAILAFRVNEQSTVEEFARNDPYVRNGLVTSWRARGWNVLLGSRYEGE